MAGQESVHKAQRARSSHVVIEDVQRPKAVLQSAHAQVQASEASAVPLLRHAMHEGPVQSANGGINRPSVSSAHGDALRPQIAGSWTSLLEAVARPPSNLHGHAQPLGQFGASVVDESVYALHDGERALQAGTMPTAPQLGGVMGVHQHEQDANAKLTLSGMEAKVSPLLRPRADAGLSVPGSTLGSPHTSGADLIRMKPMPSTPSAAHLQQAESAVATSIVQTQIACPKMPTPIPGSHSRLSALQASAVEKPRPLSLLERARAQQKAAPLLDALQASPHDRPVPQPTEDATVDAASSVSALSALSQDVPAATGATDVSSPQAAKLSMSADTSGRSPLLQNRQVPEFLKEPSSFPRQQSRHRDGMPSRTWEQPTSATDPWAHNVQPMHDSKRVHQAPGIRPLRSSAVPEKQMQADPASPSQHMSAMDMINQMVQRDSRPGQQHKVRCVSG